MEEIAKTFEKKNKLQKILLEKKALEEYYRKLRKFELENQEPIKNKEYYAKWHDKLKLFFGVSMLLSCRPIKIHKDMRKFSSSRPKIYAVTHVGRYDIETSIITRKEQAVFLWGDPGKLYKSPEKILIDRLGAIYIDTDYREDCHIGLETMIRYLKHGINIQIYPEGAWNILSGKAVMPVYDGAVIAGIEGSADIVPVAIAPYGRKNFVSYGAEIDTSEMSLQNIKEESVNLRDALATLKWELIETYSGNRVEVGDAIYTQERSSLAENANEQFIHSIMKDTSNDYGIEEIEKTRYKDRNHPEPQDVFRPLYENMELKKETAFMAKQIVLAKKRQL